MAKPIESTPVLKGKQAARFVRDVRKNEKKPIENTIHIPSTEKLLKVLAQNA